MHIADLNAINNNNTIIVLYPSGASGEFLAGTIAMVFDGVHSSQLNEYSSETRYNYFDIFDRTLNSSSEFVNYRVVLDGVNNYLVTNDSDLKHLGLAHSVQETVDFLGDYLSQCQVIEVVTGTQESKRFRIEAANSKIPKHQNFTAAERAGFTQCATLFSASQCSMVSKLCVEWSDLFLYHTEATIERIEDFLKMKCDCGEFKNRIYDYLHRNQALIERCGISPTPFV